MPQYDSLNKFKALPIYAKYKIINEQLDDLENRKKYLEAEEITLDVDLDALKALATKIYSSYSQFIFFEHSNKKEHMQLISNNLDGLEKLILKTNGFLVSEELKLQNTSSQVEEEIFKMDL